MTGIVIVVHAPLGSALRDCASHVMGNVQGLMAVHDIEADDMPDALAPLVLRDILHADQEDGVLVLTDLIGATPANIAKRAIKDARSEGVQCCFLAGINTPMLLRALTYRQLPLAQMCEKALAGGVEGVLRVD
jgi:mannose PTS system EIIA component